MYTTKFLVENKRKALRLGTWKKISQLERSIFNVTISLSKNVTSVVLCVEIMKIIKKIRKCMNPSILFLEKYSLLWAKNIAQQSQVWGNKLASLWCIGLQFARFLSFTEMNQERIIPLLVSRVIN